MTLPCRDCGLPADKPPLCLDCYHATARRAAKAQKPLTLLRISQGSPDAFYAAKFDDQGNVRAGWNFDAWILDLVSDIPKTPTTLGT